MSKMRPLVEWLGARWKLGASVVAVAWDAAGDTAGGALADGTLALVHAGWDGGPVVRPRAEGGTEVVPARQAPPPAMRAGLHTGPACCLTADGTAGFLSGGADGRLVHAAADGAVTQLARLDAGGRIACVAAAGGRRAGGRRAYAAGARLQLLDGGGLDLPAPITALAFDPAGGVLAAAHAGGVTLWDGAGAPRRLEASGLPVGTPLALAWSPDGLSVAAALQQNAVQIWRAADGATIAREDCPAAPGAVRFGADGHWLATAGAGAVLAWAFDPAGRLAPIACGIASRVPNSAAAPHPRLALVAAGYANGALTLCQPGAEDVLFVRAADGDGVTTLGWSADGALAFGTAAGELGLIVLPEQMFRARSTPQAVPELAQ